MYRCLDSLSSRTHSLVSRWRNTNCPRAVTIRCGSINNVWFHTTTPLPEEEAVVEQEQKHQAIEKAKAIKLRNKLAARDFNNRRAAYKRQVSELRSEYAKEVQRQRASDKAEEETRAKELTRQRLERQRLKNIRSAQNAVRQEEMRQQAAREFQEHLDQMQIKREAKRERFTKARQLLIDELEEVAHLWLTTPEEVEQAFTPEAEQLLWARPGGVLGEPNPSLDAHFWQYETHTWHMDRTYKSRRQVLLEKIEEMAYDEANISSSFWTEDRLEDRVRLEEKARLRGMVQTAGRIQLLKRQRDMLEEARQTVADSLPKQMASPNNRVLKNIFAQEKEGAKILLDNPTKFFVFEGTDQQSASESQESYSGPTLGAPIRLRDPLREGSDQSTVFPEVIGKYTKPDTRTEREKKKQEREERMLAAAKAKDAPEVSEVDLAAQEQIAADLEPDIDYNNVDWDSDDEDWKHGLDPEGDAHILNIPREQRYNKDEIQWVLDELDSKVKHFEEQFNQDMDVLKNSMRGEIQNVSEASVLEDAVLSLSANELMLLSDLDETYQEMSPEELKDAFAAISLTEDQLKSILHRNRD